jgi:hypothetical protein
MQELVRAVATADQATVRKTALMLLRHKRDNAAGKRCFNPLLCILILDFDLSICTTKLVGVVGTTLYVGTEPIQTTVEMEVKL